MSKNVYITTSIPYVNAKPHIGFALEYVEADMLARYYREITGYNTRLQTGSDENSLKNVEAAEKAGEPVADYVERHAAAFMALKDLLHGSYDDFIRTREDRHIKGAQHLWSSCKPEDIYKKSYKGLYCVGCEAFYLEKDLAEDGTCPVHKKPLQVVEEENYFFKLSNYQDQLKEAIESGEMEIKPESRKNEILSFIEGGLEDFSISRSQERAKRWGVPVPGDDSQVMYVWFDALSNYINALGFGSDDSSLYEQFWCSENSKTIHVIGKDINRFHTVYWPAMLMSAGQPLPKQVLVHGFFTINGEKISKSLGNVIAPEELTDKYGTDATRFLLLREMPATSDGDLSFEKLDLRYKELANQFGNLISRTAAMSVSYFEGELDEVDHGLDNLKKELSEKIDNFELKEYIDLLMQETWKLNEKIETEAPFKTVKENPKAAKKTLSETRSVLLELVKLMKPVMPEKMTIAEDALSQTVNKVEPLFPRHDG